MVAFSILSGLALFDSSHTYDQDVLSLATSYAQSLRADFGVTDLLPALQYVFEQPVIAGFI